MASTDLDESGGFDQELASGSYTITIDVGDSPFPMCEPLDVQVIAAAEVVADVGCDSGIR